MSCLIPKHPVGLFCLMLASAAVLGVTSLNLFFLLKANLALIYEFRSLAPENGALQQFVMLFVYGIASLFAFLLFEACKKRLVDWLLKESK